MATTLFTIQQIKQANRNLGHSYFEPDTIRFFRSRCCGGVFPARNGKGSFFVTSEKFVGSGGFTKPRRYTVRFCKSNGDCGTAKGREFQEFTDRRTALNAAKLMASGK
jgi:hypothetical protein